MKGAVALEKMQALVGMIGEQGEVESEKVRQTQKGGQQTACWRRVRGAAFFLAKRNWRTERCLALTPLR
jgi:hypothetical protein